MMALLKAGIYRIIHKHREVKILIIARVMEVNQVLVIKISMTQNIIHRKLSWT